MEKEIIFRTVIEVLGKPEEHVKKALKEYLEQIRTNQDYQIINEEIAEAKKQEEQELWAIFAELEIKTNNIINITKFCFDYMPSIIEIIKPKEVIFNQEELSGTLNDLQAKLHQVDMVAKQIKMERDLYRKSVSHLLGNYVTLLLTKSNLNSEQISKLTGVDKDKLEDFLDILIDQGKIDLKEGIYYIKKNGS